MTGLCANGSTTQTPSNPKMTDWEGSLAVICDKVTERRLLYLETWEQFVFMLMVTLWFDARVLVHLAATWLTAKQQRSTSKLKIAVGCLIEASSVLIMKVKVFFYVCSYKHPAAFVFTNFFRPSHTWKVPLFLQEHSQTVKIVALFDCCYP